MENKRNGRLAPIDEGEKLTPEALTYRRLEVRPPAPPRCCLQRLCSCSRGAQLSGVLSRSNPCGFAAGRAASSGPVLRPGSCAQP